MKTKIIYILKTKNEIKKVIDKIKKYSFRDLKKHSHFEFSLIEKMTDLSLIEKTFSQFKNIKSIEIRKNIREQEYYSINYELENSTFVVISLVLSEDIPMIINGFHAKRNYKAFEKSLRKNYAKVFI